MKLISSFCIFLLAAIVAQAQPNYSGVYGAASPHCQMCHSGHTEPTNQVPQWLASPHASAYDDHVELQWNAACLACHTTGWDLGQSNGGFDDYFYAGDTLGMMEMRNVQCESCHGPTNQYPHPVTTLVDYHAEVCGGCHTGAGRPTYDEWSTCRHSAPASPQTQTLACAKCHETASAAHYMETGDPPTSLPENPVWQVACAACHAAHSDEVFGPQLFRDSEVLCRTCHSMEAAAVGEEPHSPQKEMVLGIGNGAFEWPDYPYNNSCHETYLPAPCSMCHMYTNTWGNPDTTTTGHQLQPQIGFCASVGCHDHSIPPDSSFNIDNCQTEVDSLTEVLGGLLALSDTTTLEYRQAKFDYDFVVNDGSRGVHNFFYARGLLTSSIEGLPPVGVLHPQRINHRLYDGFLASPTNPFNPSTALRYQLAANGYVSLKIYDTVGRFVATLVDGWMPAGEHELTWSTASLPSGIYFARLEVGETSQVQKMVLLK